MGRSYTPDNLDYGNNPHFCPFFWKWWSFDVAKNFYLKFREWSICYHGTKFSFELAILLSGMKLAQIAAHIQRIYMSLHPSIVHVIHNTRHAEIKRFRSSEKKFFKQDQFVQFVLECHVNPTNTLLKRSETSGGSNTIIHYYIRKNVIEWLINDQDKEIVEYNDPNAWIICSSIMVKVTNNNISLLPKSLWWFIADSCNKKNCCPVETHIETSD